MNKYLYVTQHEDRNVSHADYKHLDRKLLVTSIFPTIQGEGPFLGRPAIFLRLAGCNRGDKHTGCEFCDTIFHFDKGSAMGFDEIHKQLAICLDDIGGWHRYDKPLLVITGGEPMLQNALTDFLLSTLGVFDVQIESNGDRVANNWDWVNGNSSLTLIVSPKVQPNGLYHALSDSVFSHAAYLKVLVDAREDSPYSKMPPYLGLWQDAKGRSSIYLSPLTVYKRAVKPGEIPTIWDVSDMGCVDFYQTRDNYKAAARIAQRNGWRFTCQSHLLMGLE